MSFTADAGVTLIAIVLAAALYWKYNSRSARLKLPPGPPQWPIIGNLLDIPKEKEWITYREWGRKYGAYLLLITPCLSDSQ